MKTAAISVLATLSASSLVAATPTLRIIEPSKNPTTNGVLNASGTATGVAPVTVYYSLNGSPWVPANGTTNWSVNNLIVTPGSNVFSAYVQDASSALSKTNTVEFRYVVKVPITVLTNGNGTVSPKYNGESLEIGEKYSLTAKASKGCKFTGWMLNGEPLTNSSRISFIMASNLSLTANFLDVARPVCIITFPAAKQKVPHSPINVTGRVSDNVGVAGVYYNFNFMGWQPAQLDGSGRWEADYLFLQPFTPFTIQAYAVDAAGNASLTNTVNFYCELGNPDITGPLPASLAGLVASVNMGGQSNFLHFCFGSSSYAMSCTNNFQGSYAGTYSYTVLSNNMAKVVMTGDFQDAPLTLQFLNKSTAITSLFDFEEAAFNFSAASNLVPSSSAILSLECVNSENVTSTIAFGEGMFTNADGLTYTNFGSSWLAPFSSMDMLLIETYADDVDAGNVDYLQLDFSTATNGTFTTDSETLQGSFLNYDFGTFTILSSAGPPAGNAPDSPAGLIWNVMPTNGAPIQFCFGTNTYTRTSGDTNENDVGDYSFIKTGPDTAQFAVMEAAPLPGYNNFLALPGSLAYLTFSSTNTATFITTNIESGVTNVQTGTVAISMTPTNPVPPSLAGKLLTATFSNRTETVTIDSTGGYTHDINSATADFGFYSYAQYSPNGALLYLDGDSGNIAVYFELIFTSSSTGNVFATEFDQFGNATEAIAGTFTIQ